MTTMAEFEAAMQRYENKLRGRLVTENFGAREIRALGDMAWTLESSSERQAAFDMVEDFADWCGTYEGRR